MDKTTFTNIYRELNTHKFGKKHIIKTNSGYIYNTKVKLKIQQVDLLENIEALINFYKLIDKEGNTFTIDISGETIYTFCEHNFSHYNYFCNICNKYECNLCANLCKSQEHVLENCYCNKSIFDYCGKCFRCTYLPMIVTEGLRLCSECSVQNGFDKNYKGYIYWSKPIITNFNLYEWVPINQTLLENRNPKSIFYKRKIGFEKTEHSIKLKLLREFNVNIKYLQNINILDDAFTQKNIPQVLSEIVYKFLYPLQIENQRIY